MKNDSLYGNFFKKPIAVKKPPFILNKPENDLTWPIFKVKNDPGIKNFWDRRKNRNDENTWDFENYLFTGSMLRVGKKKKLVKGYFYKLTSTGLLMYYKKVNCTPISRNQIHCLKAFYN